jgi:diguanylate cyclase (GGDEF)-like protein
MGDIALRGVADCARSIVRPSDILARLGGDEFAILLPETQLADATEIARRVLERLRGLALSGAGETIRLSGSFGVACAETGLETPQSLVKRADVALYEVKRRGRNGVEAQRFGVQPAPA